MLDFYDYIKLGFCFLGMFLEYIYIGKNYKITNRMKLNSFISYIIIGEILDLVTGLLSFNIISQALIAIYYVIYSLIAGIILASILRKRYSNSKI